MATDRGSRSPGPGGLDRYGVGPMTGAWRRFAAWGTLALFVAAILVNVYQGAWAGALMSAFLLGYAWWQLRRLALL